MATAPAVSKVNWPVFGISATLIVTFTLWAAFSPATAEATLGTAFDWLSGNLGWYFILTAAIIVVFVLIIAFTRVGRTKLGPDHSKPRFSLFTWASMLFAAGIGVDLMFFAVIGPATNLRLGPGAGPETLQAAEEAAIWTMFHYGIPGWAMYALTGIAFGLFAYRYHLPLSIRSALYPIIGKRAQGPAGDTVQIAAVLGTIFGIATSLGIGVVFLSYGLDYLFDIPPGTGVQAGLIVLAAVVVTISTVSGVEKGIRRLSELNVLMAIALMLYVLISGDTVRLLNALVKNVGDFFALLPGMMTETFAFDTSEEWVDEAWVEWWTIFFWTWWMAWALFVGLFLARISRGRTLRQFIIGVLLVPFAFNALWISIFGNATIMRIMGHEAGDVPGDAAFAEMAEDPDGAGYFSLMAEFPGATFIIGLSVLVGLLFYATSADSGALVLANFTSKTENANSDGPSWLRIVWSIIIGALTLVMLMLNGIDSLQMAAVIIGVPLSLVLYLLMVSVWRALRQEKYNADSMEATLPSALSERIAEAGGTSPGRWRRRLARHMHYPSGKEISEYMENTAMPAVEEVAAELEKQGATVYCERGTVPETEAEIDGGIPQIDLHVDFGDQAMFKYQAYPIEYSVPNFALRLNTSEETYYRVEVFSATGSAGYDVYGYSKEQLICDILDAYERHLVVLRMNDDDGAAPVPLNPDSIPDDWDHVRTRGTSE
ncbi:choline BCCT transporter BetT [Nesterenkonia sp. MY13]|uniref:Choline BCCT transporter BetT n=1 Tax=Nesterenkonia sedimenti TaxID=1463632 RepID=A0A7X8YCZ5_9MICC|nr:choline BCCT transporter BetT [Nesterenkonia sedimenti]NLS08846.1 choline BCCT transporter BetT [Nesterenkonia sedimenti]